MPQTANSGTVTLVGAGPGDPELITVKAMRALQRADAVVYDGLANPALLAHTREDCQRIYVGKRKGCHSVTQARINDILVTLAQQGLSVVRLKGGDPMIFGRGGEELEALASAGIAAEVIPGISAALGSAASMTMPLTHRRYAAALTLISAHRSDGNVHIDEGLLVSTGQTVVFYMGLSGLPEILAAFARAGRPGTTPIAVVSQATTAGQRSVIGTLDDITTELARTPVPGPALIIVGDCVQFPAQLAAQLEAIGAEPAIIAA